MSRLLQRALSAAMIVAMPTPGFGQDWGDVKGRIVWDGGELPTPKSIDAVKTHQDKTACEAKGPVFSEDWIINKENKGVRWAFVWLAPPEGAKLPIHPALQAIRNKEAVIDQPCCQFEPRALAIREGQILVVKNSAPITHNVNWTGGIKNPGNNLIIPAKGEPVVIKNLVADKFPIKLACNIHGWMEGWVRVFDHPYFAVTDGDGNFEINSAPAGVYSLVVWHEESGWGPGGKNGQQVRITKNALTDVGALGIKPAK